ncbi:MAG: NADH-quinone oxidoreductase subunit B [Deltaproteobacteria bacterium]|nr:MAG: NADH-quinone oxidoreductase subunit B [Deltaproteobacteria bacterium]
MSKDDEWPEIHGVPDVPGWSHPHQPPAQHCYLGEGSKPEQLAYQEAFAKLKNWFRANSLSVLAYGTGCGSIELRPLATSRFDYERFGFSTQGTPRQANLLILSGYLSIKTLKRVIRVYEQMPSPKWVVGLGSCTINGGMYWDSYATMKQLDLYVPVDMQIAGCMPRPEALLEGFAALMTKIKAGKANGYIDYTRRLDWYRENQKKVIKDWDLPEYNW